MPFPFTLPTTSTVSYPAFFASPAYPSLPLLAASHRGSVRNVLKSHKRLPPASQNENLPLVIKELESYASHLLALFAALESNEAFLKPNAPQFTTSWRAVLTAKKFSPDHPRVARPGLSYEIFWALSALAYAYTLQARSQVLQVLSPGTPTPTTDPQLLFNHASSNLLTSASIFAHLLSRPPPSSGPLWPPDIAPQTLSALSSLSLADATLIAVTKQDPYPTYLTLTSRDSKKSTSKDWLYNPPDPPSSVRALLLARLCIAASDHASSALGLIQTSSSTLTDDLPRYLTHLHKVARAKCCRFLGIDAESSGRTGEAIGWLLTAKSVLEAPNTTTTKSIDKLRRGIEEKREARHVAAAEGWGMDAGRAEELKVCEELEKRWGRVNDGVMFQPIPAVGELVGRIPSGREIHTLKAWEAPRLGVEEMRALRKEGVQGIWYEEEGDSEGEGEAAAAAAVPYAGKGGYY